MEGKQNISPISKKNIIFCAYAAVQKEVSKKVILIFEAQSLTKAYQKKRNLEE